MTLLERLRRAAIAALSLGIAACHDHVESTGPIVDPVYDAAIVYVRHTSASGFRADLYRVDTAGRNRLPFVEAQSYESDPAWSADGHFVAVVRDLPDFSNGGRLVRSLWTVDGRYGDLTRLPAPFDSTVAPAWSPDGKRLSVFGRGGLAVIGLDGTGAQVVAADAIVSTSPQRWSPDGTRILYTRIVGTQYQLWTVAPDGSAASRILPAQTGSNGAWSPDGRRIAFCVRDINRDWGSLYVADVDGSHVVRVTTGDADGFPVWSPDGKALAFLRQADYAGGLYAHVFVAPVGGGEARDLTPLAENEGPPAWRP